MAVDEIQPEPPRPHPPSEPTPLPDSTDPIEIALKAVHAGAPPDSPAAVLLSKQSRLIDVHRDLAQTDLRFRHLQIAGERMSVMLRMLIAIASLAVAIAVGTFLVNASRANGLVIEAFSVPPDMASNGVTGEVIANQLLDRIVRLDAQANSLRAPNTYANDWRGNVKVEIPQIGISIGELNRYMRAWLGREKRVSGELFRPVAGQSSLTVRTGSTPGDTHVGSAAELDTLLEKAAESVYARTQPYRYAVLHRQEERFDEALQVLRALEEGVDETERPWGHIGTGIVLWITEGDGASVASFAKASALDPGNALAVANLGSMERRLGRSQAAVDHLQQGIRAGEGPGGGLREDARAEYLITLRAEEALIRGDPLAAIALYRQEERRVGAVENNQYAHARALIESHQPTAALRMVRNMPAHRNERLWTNTVNRLEVVLQAAAEREDWVGLTAASDAFVAALGGSKRGLLETQRVVHLRALALARSGRLAEAQQLTAPSPPDCYPCLITRGWIAELNKDARAADRWFAEAVRQGPSLPFAHAEWGRAKLARGDIDGAIAAFTKAHEKGPRWADPMKFWGDALARQGDHAAAIRKYSDAAERAPRWGALHLAWGQALAKTDRADEARTKYRAATRMDLSTGDKARTQAAITGVGSGPVIAN